MSMIIKAEGVKRTFINGEIVTPVLKGISLTVRDGESLSIVGKSGTGKSTLLHQLSLLDTPTDGSIIILGEDTNKLSIAERTYFRLKNFGFVFQDYALLPELNARENVAINLITQGVPIREALRRADTMLQRLGLGDKVTRLSSQLSGGENQRVSIARAVVHKPKIIFADEPTANLDTETSDVVVKLLNDIHHQGTTFIMVTHEEVYAKTTERIITLIDGSIESDVKNKSKSKKT